MTNIYAKRRHQKVTFLWNYLTFLYEGYAMKTWKIATYSAAALAVNWWKNDGKEPAVLVAADIFNAPKN